MVVNQQTQQPVEPVEQESEALQPGEVQATEEEQAILEQAFGIAIEMIHGTNQSGDKVAEMVLSAQDVNEGIGQAVATVLIGVEKKTGGLPDDVKIPLAQEILAELAELAVNAGALSEEEITDQWMDNVVSHAYSSYIKAKEAMGELDPNELEASVSEAEQSMGISVRNKQPQQAQQAQPQQQKPTGLLGQV